MGFAEGLYYGVKSGESINKGIRDRDEYENYTSKKNALGLKALQDAADDADKTRKATEAYIKQYAPDPDATTANGMPVTQGQPPAAVTPAPAAVTPAPTAVTPAPAAAPSQGGLAAPQPMPPALAAPQTPPQGGLPAPAAQPQQVVAPELTQHDQSLARLRAQREVLIRSGKLEDAAKLDKELADAPYARAKIEGGLKWDAMTPQERLQWMDKESADPKHPFTMDPHLNDDGTLSGKYVVREHGYMPQIFSEAHARQIFAANHAAEKGFGTQASVEAQTIRDALRKQAIAEHTTATNNAVNREKADGEYLKDSAAAAHARAEAARLNRPVVSQPQQMVDPKTKELVMGVFVTTPDGNSTFKQFNTGGLRSLKQVDPKVLETAAQAMVGKPTGQTDAKGNPILYDDLSAYNAAYQRMVVDGAAAPDELPETKTVPQRNPGNAGAKPAKPAPRKLDDDGDPVPAAGMRVDKGFRTVDASGLLKTPSYSAGRNAFNPKD